MSAVSEIRGPRLHLMNCDFPLMSMPCKMLRLSLEVRHGLIQCICGLIGPKIVSHLHPPSSFQGGVTSIDLLPPATGQEF